jgi:hypothetical protein
VGRGRAGQREQVPRAGPLPRPARAGRSRSRAACSITTAGTSSSRRKRGPRSGTACTARKPARGRSSPIAPSWTTPGFGAEIRPGGTADRLLLPGQRLPGLRVQAELERQGLRQRRHGRPAVGRRRVDRQRRALFVGRRAEHLGHGRGVRSATAAEQAQQGIRRGGLHAEQGLQHSSRLGERQPEDDRGRRHRPRLAQATGGLPRPERPQDDPRRHGPARRPGAAGMGGNGWR